MSQSVKCGVDIVDVADFARAIKLAGGDLLNVCFTDRELTESGAAPSRLAARFAAKEAAAKALGTGLLRGVGLRDIELVLFESRPDLLLHGPAKESAVEQGWLSWCVSISHSRQSAIAIVVAATQLTSSSQGGGHA